MLVVLGGLWGWSALTQPFPGKTTPPKCVATIVQPGEKVFPGQVTVSVFNASERDGLAGRTMAEFVDAGFAEGDTGNAPRNARVVRAAIWAPTAAEPRRTPGRQPPRPGDPGGPPGGARRRRHGPRRGQVHTLVKGPRRCQARQEAEICSPPVA